MSRRRFFTDPVRSGVAELHGEDARHLTRVLRVQPGQQFEISDNSAVYLAEIAEARGETVRFRVLEPLPSPPPPLRLVLVASLVKFDRFEWMVEKATELGVESIQPVESARSEKGLLEASRKRIERWRRIAREAAQQSRRACLPEIFPAVRLEQALRSAPQSALRYFLEETSAPPLLRVLPETRSASDLAAVLLGPEGGWTDDERARAAAAGWQPVSLAPLVLRAETAAAAALAILANAWMAAPPTAP
ncbi:MAG TPA: RsmE family RNA methyltransferase [Bryobacteraceae bacterium]|nr:RsmE family RNA methyltransferase [Bryobacteraceae bacterium]